MDEIKEDSPTALSQDLKMGSSHRQSAMDKTTTTNDHFPGGGPDCESSSQRFLTKRYEQKILHGYLYGREKERHILMEHFERVTKKNEPSIELMLITGKSGMGKTTLAMCLEECHKAKFVKGKFHIRQAATYDAFSEAMSELIQKISSGKDAPQMNATRQKVRDAIGEEAGLISTLIPELADFVGQTDRKGNKLVGPEALIRFKTVFCRLISAMTSPEEPVILFLDDLQWAEKESLELLSSLLIDTSIRGLVIVGACRDNEISIDDDLAVALRDLEDNHGLRVTQVPLSGLSKKDVTAVRFFYVLCCSPFVQSHLMTKSFIFSVGKRLFWRFFVSLLRCQRIFARNL